MEETSTSARRDSLGTPSTLLRRLQDLDDHEAWTAFATMYEGFVRRIALAGGLNEHDADDIAQEVLIKVSASIHKFDRSRRPGAFRRWLGQLTRWRTSDRRRHLARRKTVEPAAGSLEDQGVDWMDQLPAAVREPALEMEEASRMKLLRMALVRLQDRFLPQSLQIYDWYVLLGVEVPRIKTFFGVSAGQIYAVKNRLTPALKAEIEKLLRELYDWDRDVNRRPGSSG